MNNSVPGAIPSNFLIESIVETCPATEWETGPEPRMAEKWLAKWPAAISQGGSQNGRKMAGQPKNHQILAVRPFSRPFFGHVGTPPPRKMAAGHFAGHFSAIFGSRPVSHSVAGQPILKSLPLGAVVFLRHAPTKWSSSEMEGFPQNSRAIAQIIGGQAVRACALKIRA